MPNDEQRQPDNVILIEKDGTKFTIFEYFDGQKELADILAQRVLRDVNPPLPNAEN
jgi:hypothetical protein